MACKKHSAAYKQMPETAGKLAAPLACTPLPDCLTSSDRASRSASHSAIHPFMLFAMRSSTGRASSARFSASAAAAFWKAASVGSETSPFAPSTPSPPADLPSPLASLPAPSLPLPLACCPCACLSPSCLPAMIWTYASHVQLPAFELLVLGAFNRQVSESTQPTEHEHKVE